MDLGVAPLHCPDDPGASRFK